MQRFAILVGSGIAIGIAIGSTALPAQTKKPAPPTLQKVVPPKSVYWLSVATTSGIGIMGSKPASAGDMMRMAMGGGANGPTKTLTLDLGSKQPASGPPAAAHAIPLSMAMGPSLTLKTPKPEARDDRRESRTPDDFERPKGKLLLFWGCGETARPGQPVVIDFATLAAGQIPPNLFGGERVRVTDPPSSSTWPIWGGWPNDDKPSQQGIPANASLLGAHKVTGNYTPDIEFTLAQDWMAGINMAQTKAPSGALLLAWNAVPGATAHFAQMIGGSGTEAEGGTMVFWSSSDAQTFISGLSDYIAPAEAARLVGRKQLLPPTQTNCAIPKEAMAATQGGMINLVAHGPEANFIHPPRPADPREPWVQEWAVKARFAARTGGVAGMDMASMQDGGNEKTRSGKPKCKPEADPASMIGGTIGTAMGMFGKKKKPVDCE